MNDNLDRFHTEGIPLLAHGLSVKFSPWPCSYSITRGESPTFGHLKSNAAWDGLPVEQIL